MSETTFRSRWQSVRCDCDTGKPTMWECFKHDETWNPRSVCTQCVDEAIPAMVEGLRALHIRYFAVDRSGEEAYRQECRDKGIPVFGGLIGVRTGVQKLDRSKTPPIAHLDAFLGAQRKAADGLHQDMHRFYNQPARWGGEPRPNVGTTNVVPRWVDPGWVADSPSQGLVALVDMDEDFMHARVRLLDLNGTEVALGPWVTRTGKQPSLSLKAFEDGMKKRWGPCLGELVEAGRSRMIADLLASGPYGEHEAERRVDWWGWCAYAAGYGLRTLTEGARTEGDWWPG